MSTARSLWIVCALALVLPACGGGGSSSNSGGGGGGGNPPQVAVVDVAVRGLGSGGERIHLYFDILLSTDFVLAPDVVIEPPSDVVAMACTGLELVVAQDLPGGSVDQVRIYTDTDLALPVPTPSVALPIPQPAAVDGASIWGMDVVDGDIYVHCTFYELLGGLTVTHWMVTYVFRDAETLATNDLPDATLTHTMITSDSLFTAPNLAMNDSAILAFGYGGIFVTSSPGTLAGNVGPDREVTSLDLLPQTRQMYLGESNVYFFGGPTLTAFADAANLVNDQAILFELDGPSAIAPVQNGLVETGGALYTRGDVDQGGPPVHGFDLDPLPTFYIPPDVFFDAPVIGEQWIDGFADTLVCGQVDGGSVSVLIEASTAASDTPPDFYLYDPEIRQIDELRVGRP